MMKVEERIKYHRVIKKRKVLKMNINKEFILPTSFLL
jgi:hypothetical protein